MSDTMNMCWFDRFRSRHKVWAGVLMILFVIGFFLLYNIAISIFLFIDDLVVCAFLGDIFCFLIAFFMYRKHIFGIADPVRMPSEVPDAVIPVGMLAVIFSLQTVSIFLATHIPDAGMEARTGILNESSILLQLILSVIVAPITEEFIFRLVSYNALKKGVGWVAAAVISSLLFAVCHGTITHMITATALGFMFCLVYEYTGRWWASVWCHITYNAGLVVLGLFEYDKIAAGSTVLFAICSLVILCIITVGICMVIHRHNTQERMV